MKPASPAPPRAGRRAPTRAARGRKVVAAVKRAPPAPKPRRKGVQIVDLEADPACENPHKAVAGLEVAGAAKNLAVNKVAEVGVKKGLRMEGESAEKIVGADDDSTATPVPERV